MKRIFLFIVIAFMAIMTSGCGKVNGALDRITYLYDDSRLNGMSKEDIFKLDKGLREEALYAKTNLKLDIDRIRSNMDYTYKSKQAEMLSLMDVIVAEYDNKFLQGTIVIQGSVPSSSGSHTVKTWTLHFGKFK